MGCEIASKYQKQDLRLNTNHVKYIKLNKRQKNNAKKYKIMNFMIHYIYMKRN